MRRPDVSALVLLVAIAIWVLPAPAAASDAVWSLLRGGGQVVMLRHGTTTPGVGDPPGFRLEDCATQRNLSEEGRSESRRIGAAFRARGIPMGQVLSSPWCRCLETARLAFGRAEPWTALNNLFGNRSREAEQVAAMRERVSQRPAGGNLVLVTHGSTIQALTGQSVAMGEFLVVTPEGGGRFRVAGRVPPSALE
jgi:broad specificity phosphatase PhoE